MYDTKHVEEILRVNHAGEYGAKRIYLGQLSVLQDDPCIKEMYEQELEHLHYFENQLVEQGVRPTMLSPLWHSLGFCMGALSAKLGREAAMACTVAVEEVIDEHYQEQLSYLRNKPQHAELRNKIAKFREDELHHRDTALLEGAEKTNGYKPLSMVVRFITKSAILLSKKI